MPDLTRGAYPRLGIGKEKIQKLYLQPVYTKYEAFGTPENNLAGASKHRTGRVLMNF
jgi:hypothetical protein